MKQLEVPRSSRRCQVGERFDHLHLSYAMLDSTYIGADGEHHTHSARHPFEPNVLHKNCQARYTGGLNETNILLY